MVYFGSLLVALVLGTQSVGAIFLGCGTDAEKNACKAAYDAVPATVLATKCAAGGEYLTCMTPAASCLDKAAITAITTANTAFHTADCKACAAYPVCQTVTTTVTPWDSSASSEDSGSGDSLKSSWSDSLHIGSSGSDSSDSAKSSGSKASGSSGSFLQNWQWLLLIALCCCCCAAAVGALACFKPKPKPKPRPRPPPPMPEPEPMPIVEPVLEPLMPEVPLVPNFFAQPAVPSYSMPVMQQYAAPVSYAAPVTTAYAQPTYAAQSMATVSNVAAPMTTAYAQPTYAAQSMPTVSNVGYNQPGLVMEQPGGYVV